ncbi:low-density lipoprotein receptor-related protein 11-like [Watersipora subatra]|uniref:low-density lipoprotein receptor-related protein 11-like n=1 Tax=Watersipora subatra TaxID=2589382 RepID=UPI00355C43AC
MREYDSVTTESYSRIISCSSGGCIDNEQECDGVNNCGDGSDEANCAGNTSTTSKPKQNNWKWGGPLLGVAIIGVILAAVFIIYQREFYINQQSSPPINSNVPQQNNQNISTFSKQPREGQHDSSSTSQQAGYYDNSACVGNPEGSSYQTNNSSTMTPHVYASLYQS